MATWSWLGHLKHDFLNGLPVFSTFCKQSSSLNKWKCLEDSLGSQIRINLSWKTIYSNLIYVGNQSYERKMFRHPLVGLDSSADKAWAIQLFGWQRFKHCPSQTHSILWSVLSSKPITGIANNVIQRPHTSVKSHLGSNSSRLVHGVRENEGVNESGDEFAPVVLSSFSSKSSRFCTNVPPFDWQLLIGEWVA